MTTLGYLVAALAVAKFWHLTFAGMRSMDLRRAGLR